MLQTSTLTTALSPERLAIATAPLLPNLSILRHSSGTLTFNNGQLTSDFKTPTGETKSTIESAKLTNGVSSSIQQLQGTITFDQGTVTSNLTTPTGNLTGTITLAQVVNDIVNDALKSISGSIAFSDGKFDIDTSTLLGEVKGSIEFGNGALVTNLTTPLGYYFSSTDFKEQDQFKFNSGSVPGVVNFNDGVVILDPQPQSKGETIAFPLNAIRGNATFKNGQATLILPTLFGSVATNFDLSALVTGTANKNDII